MSDILDSLAIGTSSLGHDRQASSWRRDVATASAALSSSVAYVDTANAYAQGRSEQVIGEALRSLGPRVRTPVVTKVDADPETGVFDRDRVWRSIEESLGRLGVERLPLVHLHDPYTISIEEAFAPGGAVEGLIELRRSGVVDHIGIAAGPVDLVGRYVDSGVFDAVLVHNRFTLVDREAHRMFARAHTRGMTVFNAAVFGGGILAAGDRPGARYAYRPASEPVRARVRRLQSICVDLGVPLAAAALQFSLREPSVDITVVGAGSPARVEELTRLARAPLPERLWDEIDALGPGPARLDGQRIGGES